MKPSGIKSFLTFDFMDRTLKCGHSLECGRAILYCSTDFVLQFLLVCYFGKKILILDASVFGVKELN